MQARLCEDGARLRRDVMRAMVSSAVAGRQQKSLANEPGHLKPEWDQAMVRIRIAEAIHSEVKRAYEAHRKECALCKGR